MEADASEKFAIVERGYDHVASSYLRFVQHRQVDERDRLMAKLLKQLSPGARVLELGCGAGVPVTQQLVEYGLKVTGVDISEAQIDLARKTVPAATLIHANMLELQFESEDISSKDSSETSANRASFDAVVAMYSIFHIPLDKQEAMLVKIISWLRPGGLLLFNLNTDKGDTFREDWMGRPMFSCSLGIEGNREMLNCQSHSLKLLEDNVVHEAVGRAQIPFHWVLAQKVQQSA